ncbi:MAG: helix-turn-helix domain-containing protein [Azospirillaceae bacterium]
MRVLVVSAAGEPFLGHGGVPIVPDASLATVGAADVILATDVAPLPNLDLGTLWPAETEWLRQRYADGAIVCSACSGSLILGRSGLLDGLPATTHWGVIDLFRQFLPQVDLQPERLLIETGESGRLITAGGASAYEDLALRIIARLRGRAEAVRIAKIFLFGDRAEGQLPFAGPAPPRRHEDRAIAEAQAWLADNYAVDNPVSALVQRSGLAERTFTRRFKAATGLSPIAYLHVLRIEEAKQALETTDDAIDAIGLDVGYQDPSFFRRLFKRQAGITPARYRQRYRNLARADRVS